MVHSKLSCPLGTQRTYTPPKKTQNETKQNKTKKQCVEYASVDILKIRSLHGFG